MSLDSIVKFVVGVVIFGAVLVLSIIFWSQWAKEMEPQPIPDEYLPHLENELNEKADQQTKG